MVNFIKRFNDFLEKKREEKKNRPTFVIEDGMLVKYRGKDSEVVIPDGVVGIECKAFFQCSTLTHVVIPETVTYIGDSAFAYCRSLRSVAVPSGVTELCSSAFAGCESLVTAVLPGNILWVANDIFDGCDNIKAMFAYSIGFSFGDSVGEIRVDRFVKRALNGEVPQSDLEEVFDAISYNPVPYFSFMGDELDFYRLALENRGLKKDDVDAVLEFTESMECRALLLEYKNKNIGEAQ